MPTKHDSGKRRPAAERYEQIIQAATRVFYERGYSDASIQEIADEVGILKGSLYYYIQSKEDLLYDILKKVHEDVETILNGIKDLEGEPPLARLREYIYRIVLYNTRHLPSITVYFHEMDRLQDAQHEDIVHQRRSHEQEVSNLILQAQEVGDCDRTQDAKILTNFAFGALIWIDRWFRTDGRLSDEAIANACADFVLHGVVGNAPTSRRSAGGADWRSDSIIATRP